MKPKTVFRMANVSEFKDRWLWRERGVYRDTAAQLLRYIKADNKKIVKPDQMLITTIDWHVRTLLGADIVRSLTDPYCAVDSKKGKAQ